MTFWGTFPPADVLTKSRCGTRHFGSTEQPLATTGGSPRRALLIETIIDGSRRLRRTLPRDGNSDSGRGSSAGQSMGAGSIAHAFAAASAATAIGATSSSAASSNAASIASVAFIASIAMASVGHQPPKFADEFCTPPEAEKDELHTGLSLGRSRACKG